MQESDTWHEGDILEFAYPKDDYFPILRFISLDKDDPIGFFAQELEGDHWSEASGSWTRGHFTKRPDLRTRLSRANKAASSAFRRYL